MGHGLAALDPPTPHHPWWQGATEGLGVHGQVSPLSGSQNTLWCWTSLGVSLSPPMTEVQIPEADRQFHTCLLRALRAVWLTAAVKHARDKQSNQLGRRWF